MPGPPYCFNGNCVDKVCCQNQCTLGCYSCVMVDTDQPDGTCAPVKMGTDPANECNAPTPNCNGTSNACQ